MPCSPPAASSSQSWAVRALAGHAPAARLIPRHFRNTRDALLDAFDAPDGNATTPRRNTTTTATQALLLINGEWTLARAKALAARLERLGLARPTNGTGSYWHTAWPSADRPESDEVEAAARFLDCQAQDGWLHWPRKPKLRTDHACTCRFLPCAP